jgi:hypothetical protein
MYIFCLRKLDVLRFKNCPIKPDILALDTRLKPYQLESQNCPIKLNAFAPDTRLSPYQIEIEACACLHKFLLISGLILNWCGSLSINRDTLVFSIDH